MLCVDLNAENCVNNFVSESFKNLLSAKYYAFLFALTELYSWMVLNFAALE